MKASGIVCDDEMLKAETAPAAEYTTCIESVLPDQVISTVDAVQLGAEEATP